MASLSKSKTNLTSSSRETVLDAAEVVVNSQGVARLTLDTVARQAGLSKSGLLHHFPSKEALIDAIVARTVGLWKSSMEAAIRSQADGSHPTVRGLLECSLGDLAQWNDRLRRSSTALLTVLVHCPGKRTEMHDFYQGLLCKMQQECSGQPTGDLILAVIDGIWLRWVTGLAPLDEQQIVRIRDTLQGLLQTAVVENSSGKGHLRQSESTQSIPRSLD
jgi:AcrR family transcriptional regulator